MHGGSFIEIHDPSHNTKTTRKFLLNISTFPLLLFEFILLHLYTLYISDVATAQGNVAGSEKMYMPGYIEK